MEKPEFHPTCSDSSEIPPTKQNDEQFPHVLYKTYEK
jgi:hypothetical protein